MQDYNYAYKVGVLEVFTKFLPHSLELEKIITPEQAVKISEFIKEELDRIEGKVVEYSNKYGA